MADKITKVLGSKVNLGKLLDLLNAALAEEWIAYYQYWIGAQVARGIMRKEIQDEFMVHAQEEAEHAQWLCNRIIELNGVPEVMNPKDWDKLAKCKFKSPVVPDTDILLNQNLNAEECAIDRYVEIIEYTCNADVVTCELAKTILAKEQEHAQDLSNYIEDIKTAKKTF